MVVFRIGWCGHSVRSGLGEFVGWSNMPLCGLVWVSLRGGFCDGGYFWFGIYVVVTFGLTVSY